MANYVYNGVFSSHAVLPSAQMDALVYAINNHDHGTEPGGGIPVSLTLAQVLATGIAQTIGSSILYGNGSGGFNNVTIGPGVVFSAGTLYIPYVKVSDVEVVGTNGGTASTSGWYSRILNTLDADTCGITSAPSGNEITLPAGSYVVKAISQFLQTEQTQLRLQNITNSTTLLTGISSWIFNGSTGGYAELNGLIVLSGSSALALQYQVAAAHGTNDLGQPCSFGPEVYTTLEFTKIA